jgi:hypothetical protein
MSYVATYYVLHYSPNDYPEKFVVRPFELHHDPDGQPFFQPQEAMIAETLQIARSYIPDAEDDRQLTCFLRSSDDIKSIVESWL